MEKTKFTKQDFIDYCNAHPDEVNKILNDKRSVDEVKKSFRCHWTETMNYQSCVTQCKKCEMELK